MRHILILTALALTTPLATAIPATITPAQPDPITLNDSDTATTTYAAEQHPEIDTYTWSLIETSTTAQGTTATLTYTDNNPKENTVRLTTSNETTANTTTITQILTDTPSLALTADTTELASGETTTITATASTTYDAPVTVDWSTGDTDTTNTTYTHDGGTTTITANATDSAGYTTTRTITISEPSTDDDGGGSSGGGGSGGGGGLAPASDDTNATDDQPPTTEGTINKALSQTLNRTVRVIAQAQQTRAITENLTVTTTTYQTTSTPVSRVDLNPSLPAQADLELAIPKDQVATVDNIHGNYNTIQRDPVIYLDTPDTTLIIDTAVNPDEWVVTPVKHDTPGPEPRVTTNEEPPDDAEQRQALLLTGIIVFALLTATYLLYLYHTYHDA